MRHICEQLGIPHHIVDSREVFQANIVDYLVGGTAPVSPSALFPVQQEVKFGPDGTVFMNNWALTGYGSLCPNQLRPKVRALSAAKGGRPE